MYNHVDSLITIDPDPCVMIIYDKSTEKVKEKLLKRFPYAELIDTSNLKDSKVPIISLP